MTSGGGGNGRAPLSEINVTPLVDVMLVLLIIFMVAAPMMTAGIQVELPRADAPQMEIDEQKLMISIDRDRRIFIGEEEVPYARFADAVRTNVRIRDDGEVFIQADAAVPYGFVAEVLAMLQRAGVENFGLVTDPMGTSGVGAPAQAVGNPRAAPANLAAPANRAAPTAAASP